MRKLYNLIRKTFTTFRKFGLGQTLKTVRNWILAPEMRKENKLNVRQRYDNVDLLLRKIDFSKSYRYGSRTERVSDKSVVINWIISPFHIGSGGHQTIFRFVKFLQERGYRNRLYITDGHTFKNPVEANELIQRHFFEIKDLEVNFIEEKSLVNGEAVVEDSDFLIATRYNTVYYAALVDNCMERLYFLQDLEQKFFATGYESIVAENSYKLGFRGVCASKWLAEEVAKFGMEANAFYLGYDPGIYKELSLERVQSSVAFYARYESERRAVPLGMAALEIVQEEIPDLRVYLYGSNDVLQGYQLNYENRGVLNYIQMAELFNQASVGLSFSLTNYSLTPTEMMACGLPVVELDGENTRAVFSNGDNIILSKSNPRDVADSVIRLLKDNELRQRITRGGLQFVKDKDWDSIWSRLEAEVLRFEKG